MSADALSAWPYASFNDVDEIWYAADSKPDATTVTIHHAGGASTTATRGCFGLRKRELHEAGDRAR